MITMGEKSLLIRYHNDGDLTMTKCSPARAQRRFEKRKQQKEQKKVIGQSPSDDNSPVTMRQFKALISDTHKLFEQIKLLDNHIWMILETLERKEILGWSDVNVTEALYLKRNDLKKEKITELLQKEFTTDEFLEEIEEDPKLPGYEKLGINPIKDLNLNPFEVASCLKEANPSLNEKELLTLGKLWAMTPDHFAFKHVEDKDKP